MSHAHATVSSSSNFQLIINNALDKYKKRTQNDLLAHPLAAQLQSCNSPSTIFSVLQQQVQELEQSRSSDERWSRWLDPTVNTLYALSSTVAAGVGLVCLRTCVYLSEVCLIFIWQVFSPANIIFAAVGVLLSVRIPYYFRVDHCNAYISQAAKDARASHDTLLDIFERIEMFFQRLGIYTEVPPTIEMTDITIQIMVEVLSILGIATKEVKYGRMSKYLLYRYYNIC
jgi:hypothetical protein